MSITTLLLVLCLQLPTPAQGRPYWRVTVKQTETTRHTHIEVVGTVTRVVREADGDWHCTITDGKGSLVLELIPAISLPRPRRGTRIVVRGILRFDRQHGWYEVHPVEAWAETK